ncbi:MAG: hypothetical protein AAFQ82_14980, partial [Myxococcota bacterium]
FFVLILKGMGFASSSKTWRTYLAWSRPDVGELFSNGTIPLLIAAFVVVEGIAVSVLARRHRKSLSPTDVFGQLAAGFFLLLATRSALLGHSWVVVAGLITAALPIHLMDLVRRWQRA